MLFRRTGFLMDAWVRRSTLRLKNNSNFSHRSKSCSPLRIGSCVSSSTSKSISLVSVWNDPFVAEPNAYKDFTSCVVHSWINSLGLFRMDSSKFMHQITKFWWYAAVWPLVMTDTSKKGCWFRQAQPTQLMVSTPFNRRKLRLFEVAAFEEGFIISLLFT